MTPYLTQRGSRTVLIAEGKPFALLAGEVHNSDSSSPAYMEHVWEIADRLGMNALLLPVTWEMTEPEEGRFDFSVPRALIRQARERAMHIVFLWFGSWKNAECMYAPGWVKMDPERFPRAQIRKGRNKAGRRVSPDRPLEVPYTSLSYLGEETARADARAFAAFMGFLKEFDGNEQTVVAIQVENETGLLGAAREVSDAADAAFASQVPKDLAAYLRAHTGTMTEETRAAVLSGREEGSWREVFGGMAEEIFSAYHVARFVNTVAEAGKKVYPLPMAVNCWLDKGGEPGTYPTGGPVSKVHEVWDLCAPAIDVYCPDIYVPQFKAVCDEYTRRGGPLFIPETAIHSYCASRLLYSIGHYHAMCYAPFGFDDIGKPLGDDQAILFGVDVTDPALKTRQRFEDYALLGTQLREMLPMLTEAYGTERLRAVSAETDPAAPAPDGDPFGAGSPEMDFGAFRLRVTFRGPSGSRGDGACLCLAVGETECWIVGRACRLAFLSGREDCPNLDLLLLEEGHFVHGTWIPGRRLNGDEGARLAMEQPAVWHARFFTYR